MLRKFLRVCFAAVQIAAVCGLRLGSKSDVHQLQQESRIPCRSTASPFKDKVITQKYKSGQDLFVGRFEQPARYADRPGERSPNRIKVGCDATEQHGQMCEFFASTFIRTVFPSSDIEIIPGPSDRSHEADIAFVNSRSTSDDLCLPERREQEILSPHKHSSGWTDGVNWPPNGNVSLHKTKRPFCVCQEFEPAYMSIVHRECDVYITHFSKLFFESATLQCPTIYMPESYRDMGLRWLNVPQDVTFDRGEDDTTLQPLSTICQTNRLKKDRFMAFMHGSCWKGNYPTSDFWLRISLFDELADNYKTPQALGWCRAPKVQGRWPDSDQLIRQQMSEYNLSLEHRLDRFEPHPASFADEAVLAWEPFKFAVVFQNTHEAGAVQEKIVHAWLARSVPVYFGPPEALTDYNPESFINCGFADLDSKLEQVQNLQRELEKVLYKDCPRDVCIREFEESLPEFKKMVKFTRNIFANDFQECVQKVKAVDQDEKAWSRMVHTPVFKGNSIEGTVFDMEIYARRFREVLEAASSAVIS
jgi:hypothetical protein